MESARLDDGLGRGRIGEREGCRVQVQVVMVPFRDYSEKQWPAGADQ